MGAEAALTAISCVDKCVEQQRSSFILPPFVPFHLLARLIFLPRSAADIKAGFPPAVVFAPGQVCVL